MISINDPKFQVKLVILMLRNPEFLRHYRHAIRSEWFDSAEIRLIVDVILTYFDDYKTVPDFDTLEFLLSNISKDMAWGKLLSIVKKHGDDGLSYVYDHFSEFVQYKSYKESIILSAKYLEEGKYDKIPEAIRQAQHWDKQSIPYVDFFDNIDEWLREEDIRDTITTGMEELDQVLHGGTARGELTVVLAAPGQGKTMTLVNLGSAAVLDGRRVYHFHSEQSSSVIRARYTARMTGIPYHQIKEDPEYTKSILDEIKEYNGSLLISRCAGSTIGAIRAFIYRFGKPDVVIIDYADKLVSKRKYNERRHEIAAIYDEMIIMGYEFNASIITASQTNRQALGKEKITIADIAEAYEKAAIADNIIAIAQTEEEKAANNLRLVMAKIRNEDGSAREVECKILYDVMKIVPVVEYLNETADEF